MIDLTIGRIFTGWDWDSDLDLDVDDRIDTMSRWSVSSYRYDRGDSGRLGDFARRSNKGGGALVKTNATHH